jgi:hypothetical protein
MTAAPFPEVTAALAVDDVYWFDAHPSRRFRVRRGPDRFWLIYKSGDTLRRASTCNAFAIPDTDAEIATLWFLAAWPELSFPKANRKSRQAGVQRAGGRG